MYTETDDVYRDRRCIQRQTMYTETDDVYRNRRCIQRQTMYTDTISIKHKSWLWVFMEIKPTVSNL